MNICALQRPSSSGKMKTKTGKSGIWIKAICERVSHTIRTFASFLYLNPNERNTIFVVHKYSMIAIMHIKPTGIRQRFFFLLFLIFPQMPSFISGWGRGATVHGNLHLIAQAPRWSTKIQFDRQSVQIFIGY